VWVLLVGLKKIVSGMMDKKRFEITAQNDR
jgi:hypothetical protein